MISIRDVKENDYADVLRLGARYAADTLIGSFTDEQINNIINACFTRGIILAAETDSGIVGLIGGIFIEGLTVGRLFEEVIWYVEPEHRGIGVLLYDRLINKCKDKGCIGVAMSAYNNKYLKVVDRFYKSKGFEEVERKYYKKF